MAEDLFSRLRPDRFDIANDPNHGLSQHFVNDASIVPQGFLDDNSVTSDTIRTNAVIAAKISAGAVETDKLAAGAVTAAKIQANTITANEIAAGTITGNEIAANSITSGHIVANTIVAGDIAANTITASEIAANTITASEIAANTLTASEIAASAITADEIAANAVTTTKILAANVVSSKIELTVSGKNFGVNSGTGGNPGLFFDSNNDTGLFLHNSATPAVARDATITFVFGGNIDGSSSSRNTSALHLRPSSDGNWDLGSGTVRWGEVFAVAGTINTSDVRLKRDIADAPLGLDFVKLLRPRVFRWKETPDTQAREKAEADLENAGLSERIAPLERAILEARKAQLEGGDEDALNDEIDEYRNQIAAMTAEAMEPVNRANALRRPGRRLHYGLIAQEVKDALDQAGVSSMDAGFWRDGEGGQALLYSELMIPLLRAVQELAAEVESLRAGNQ